MAPKTETPKLPLGKPLDVLMGSETLDLAFLFGHERDFEIAGFLRELYDTVASGPADQGGEREARLDLARHLKTMDFFADAEKKWPKLDMPRRAMVIELLSRAVADRLGIPRMKYICATNLSPGDDMDYEGLKYRPNFSKGAADSYAEIFDRKNSLLDTFHGALEAFIFLSVRHYQFALATDPSITCEDPRYKNARLYKLDFYREFVAESFPWSPGEFDKWLNEPGLRHAFEAVYETMGVLTGQSDYQLSDNFISGWGRRFNRLWQEALFETQASAAEKLARYEKFFSAANDDCLRDIDDIWRKNLVCELRKLGSQGDGFDSRANAVITRLIDAAPDPFSFSISLLNTSQQKIALAKTFNRAALTDMNLVARVAMIDALTDIKDPVHRKDALQLALNFLASNPYPAALEAQEDKLLETLKDRLDADPVLAMAQKSWHILNFPAKMTAMRRVMEIHAATFGYEPAEELATFCVSREEYEMQARARGEAPIYPAMVAFRTAPTEDDQILYPKLNLTKKWAIAINIHADALDSWLSSYEQAESFIIHEQTHQNDFQESERVAKGKPTSDSHDVMADTILLQNQIAHKAKDDKEYAHAFYRAAMIERHAYAVHSKMKSLRECGLIPSEAMLLCKDLVLASITPAML